MNIIALILTEKNRLKHKRNGRKRKVNWLRPQQQELLQQFSNSKMYFNRKICLILSI